MITVDTSALLAVVLSEPAGEACFQAMKAADAIVISAGTLAEASIVSLRRTVARELQGLVESFYLHVSPVTLSVASQIGDAYRRWGKGIHPAGLNFGDCFAHVAAKEHGCPLLYVGNDFSKTDIESVL